MLFRHKSGVLTALFCCCAALLSAQKEQLPTESVDVFKDFEVNLLESDKINVAPSLPPLDTSTKRQNYQIPPKPLVVNYDAPKLRPIGMKAGRKEDIYNGYVKAGGGVPSSLYGEAGYFLNYKDQFDGKVWFRHHSLNASKSVENQRFFNNDFLLNGTYLLKNNLAVEGKVGYSADRYHYYGYPDSLDLDPEGVRQNFKIFDLGARVFNSQRTDNDLNFHAAPKLYTMSDFYSNSERGFDFNFGATKWFAEKHPLRLNIRTDFTTYEDTVTQKLNNIYLQPSFTFHSDVFKIKIGGNFASNRDVFSIFPDAELTLRIFGDGIQLFAGASGDLRKNTYRSIAEYNPFIQMRGSELKNTRYDNYYGGIKGNLGWLDYNAQVQYAKASDLALFQTLFETGAPTRFRVLYDTVNIFSLQGTVKFTPIPGLNISGTLAQSVFDLNNEKDAWGLPGLEGNFSAAYSVLEGKAVAKASLYIADRIAHLADDGRPDEGGALIDLSLGGTYQFSKNFGAFVDINNLLNNRRERWADYPTIGTNFMIGLTARF
jgi:hypothetical protein